MELGRYVCNYFDRLEWDWKTVYVVALDESSARALIDKKIDLDFRNRPYSDSHQDSLTIEMLDAVELPYIERYGD